MFVFKITPSANESEYKKVLIPLALMRYRDFLEARKVRSYCIHLLHSFIAYQIFKLFCLFFPQVFGEEMQVKLYSPPHSKIDPSIAVMLVIAVLTVVLGGFWSGECER